MCNQQYDRRGFGRGRHQGFHPGFHPGFGSGSFSQRFQNHEAFKVPVNILKNDGNYELQVFAPDRTREDFKINMKGNELSISYHLKGEESKSWIRHEFQKSSFERSFRIEESIDENGITANYVNGILYIILPVVPGSEVPTKEIIVE